MRAMSSRELDRRLADLAAPKTRRGVLLSAGSLALADWHSTFANDVKLDYEDPRSQIEVDWRIADRVGDPNAPVRTLRTFAVESGRPGVAQY
jgi:hypothetical protein